MVLLPQNRKTTAVSSPHIHSQGLTKNVFTKIKWFYKILWRERWYGGVVKSRSRGATTEFKPGSKTVDLRQIIWLLVINFLFHQTLRKILDVQGVRACWIASVMTLCNPMDCSLPGSSVHGILQARILECDAMSSSRKASEPKRSNQHLLRLQLWQAGSLPLALPGKTYLIYSKCWLLFQNISTFRKNLYPNAVKCCILRT